MVMVRAREIEEKLTVLEDLKKRILKKGTVWKIGISVSSVSSDCQPYYSPQVG